jgi:O-antigen/teichoic acid export membrane protein
MKEKFISEIKKERLEIQGIFTRIKKRDFSGNTGMVVKNSMYQFSTNLVAKFGSLIFTIILARLLMPELFGLYNLALSTILIFASLSDLGISQTFIRFVSRAFGKNKKSEAKIISSYIIKKRIIFLLLSMLLLLLFSKLLSIYYGKPIFYALIAGAIYILASVVLSMLDPILITKNNFRGTLFKEIIFQTTRLIVVTILVFYSLQMGQEAITTIIILGLSLSAFISILISLLIFKKDLAEIVSFKAKKISSDSRKKINVFIKALSLTFLSGIFFSYIDVFFLGRFASSENIGYYKAALSLIYSSVMLISFSLALLPIFSKLDKKRAIIALKKSVRVNLFISAAGVLASYFLANLLIKLIYGAYYSPAVLIFQVFTLLLITEPLISIYSSFHISQNNPKKVTKAIIYSTLINLFLNTASVIFVTSQNLGGYTLVIGVSIATVLSRFVYLILLTKVGKITS